MEAANIFGRQIGRYILLERLGEGGMATVYNAYDTRLERNVAIKIIHSARQNSDVFLKGFRFEAKSLAQLAHRNIVKVLDFGDHEGTPFLVMEYIPNGTLKQLMTGPMDWREAAILLAPIARGLEYVHTQRIIHRDVKPSNILMKETGEPMLSDFGIIKALEQQEDQFSGVGVGMGTPDYMSPEQAMGKEVDYRADIYALGVIFFEMVTGRRPFHADTPMAVIIKQATEPVPQAKRFVRDLPDVVDQILQKAMEKDPARRFQTMGEFAGLLETLAQNRKVKINLPRNKKRAWAKQVLTVILVLIVALVLTVASLESFGKLPAVISKVIYTETLNPTAVFTAAPSPTATSTQTSLISPEPILRLTITPTPRRRTTPMPTLRPAVEISLRGTPIVSSNLTLGDTRGTLIEIARWGIGNVESIAYSPNGDQIAVGSSAGVFVYDSGSLALDYYLPVQGWVTKVKYPTNGTFLFVGTRQGAVEEWELRSEHRVYEYRFTPKADSASNQINDIDVCDQFVAAGSSDQTIRVWTYRGSQAQNPLNRYNQEVASIAFSPDERFIASGTPGGRGKELLIWNLSRGMINQEIDNHSSVITTLKYSSSGEYLFSAGIDGNLLIFGLSSDPNFMKLVGGASTHHGAITDMSVSQDDKLVAVSTEDGSLILYDLNEQWQPVERWVLEDAHPDSITGIGISPDGSHIISSSYTRPLNVWPVSPSAPVEPEKQITENTAGILSLQYSPNGALLAVNRSNGVTEVWDHAKAAKLYEVPGHIKTGQAFSPNNAYLAVGYVDRKQQTVTVYSAKTGEKIVSYSGLVASQIGFSTDGNTLIAGNRRQVWMWDVASWQPLAINSGITGGCVIAYGWGDRKIGVVSQVGILTEWNTRVETLCGLGTPTFLRLELLSPVTLGITFTHTDPNFDEFGSVRLWNLSGNVSASRLPVSANLGRGKSLAFSPDGRFIVTADETNDRLGIYSITGNGSNSSLLFTLEDYQLYNFSPAIYPDDSFIALGGSDGTIRFFER